MYRIDCRDQGGYLFPEVDPVIRSVLLTVDFDSPEAPTFVTATLTEKFRANNKSKYYFAVAQDESMTGGYCVAWGVYAKSNNKKALKILVWLNGRDI